MPLYRNTEIFTAKITKIIAKSILNRFQNARSFVELYCSTYRLNGLVLLSLIFTIFTTPLLAQPSEDIIRRYIAQQLQPGFELSSMDFRAFAGAAGGTGRISIEGRLRATEDLFVETDFTEFASGLRSEGLTQEEIDAYILNIHPQGSVHLFAWRLSHRSGAQIPFSAELRYTERVSGFALDGPVTHSSRAARTMNQVQRSRTIFDRLGVHLVYGDESMDEFRRQVLLQHGEEEQAREWARAVFLPLAEGAKISFEDEQGVDQIVGEIRIPEQMLESWEVVQVDRAFGRGGLARHLQAVGQARVKALQDFRPATTLLSAGQEYAYGVNLRVDLTPGELAACVVLGRLEDGWYFSGSRACWDGIKWTWDGVQYSAIWDSVNDAVLEFTHGPTTTQNATMRLEGDWLSGALSAIEAHFTSSLGVDSEFAQDALVAADFYEGEYAPYAPGGRYIKWTPKIEQAFRAALEYAEGAGIDYDLSNVEGYYEFLRAIRERRLTPADLSNSTVDQPVEVGELSRPIGASQKTRFGPRAIVDDPREMPSCFPLNREIDWRSCMRDLGARDEAIAFSAALQQMRTEGYLTAYMLRGDVDIGRVYLPNIANTNEQYVLLNAQHEIIMPHTLAPRQPPTDGASRTLQRQYPNAMLSGRLFPIGYRDLPDGEQRFVFTDILTDGCRGCEIIGSAILYFDFRNGTLYNNEVVGWTALTRNTNLPSADYALTREVANRMLGGDVRELQTQLNLKGFRAGGMDGVVGAQTRGALTEFLAENCQPGPEQLTTEGVNRLSLQLGDIEEGIVATGNLGDDTLFAALDAMHHTLQPCGPPKATLEQYHPEFLNDSVNSASAGEALSRAEAAETQSQTSPAGTEAETEALFNRDDALDRAVRALLGDPYGRTPEEVRANINNFRFGIHDVCKGDPAWIFDIHVTDPVSMPGQQISGYLVLEDATGILRCAGLPFLP